MLREVRADENIESRHNVRNALRVFSRCSKVIKVIEKRRRGERIYIEVLDWDLWI